MLLTLIALWSAPDPVGPWRASLDLAVQNARLMLPYLAFAGPVTVLMGLLNARYLNDPVQAKLDVAEAIKGLPGGQERALADELIAELG